MGRARTPGRSCTARRRRSRRGPRHRRRCRCERVCRLPGPRSAAYVIAVPEPVAAKLPHLPESPGVYLWKDAAGIVLYVGKAKRLRSRVRSYFASDFPTSARNQVLQRLIADVETIVVPSEAQSLILENNLIKEYRPRFNVRLKDDKRYPSIAVTVAEPFPRVLVTRRRNIPGARHFGPDTDVRQ